MKAKTLILLLTIPLFICSCGTTKLSKGTTALNQKTSAGYIPNRLAGDNVSSYGTVFFDATKRSAVTTIFDPSKVTPRYLAEEQPDAAITFIEKITAKLEGDLKAAEIDAMGEFAKDVQTSFEGLTHKSNALNYLRSSLYRLNEGYYNNNIDSTYIVLYSKALDNAKEIQLLELKLSRIEVQTDTIAE